jgi:hypothetical protein
MSCATFARDDFYKLIAADDFFEHNPAFAPVQETVTQCKQAYVESAAKKSCGCGGSSQLIFGCLDATLALMETFRAENPEALTTLLEYVRRNRGDQRITAITLYYRKTSQEPLLKVTFP